VTRHELEDERTFLLRSLADLDREHDAGDLSDEDHAVLRDGYTARTAEVLKSLDGAKDGGTTTTPEPRARRVPAPRRRLLITAGLVVAVVGGALASVLAHVGPRLPGESVTGSVTLTASQQAARTLVQAETDESHGDAADAVKQYQSVLRQEPTQEQALAELGWLEYEAGAQARASTLLSLGEAEEQKAEGVDPSDFAPHLYLGSMLLAQGDPAGAVDQYRQFLADHPPRAKVIAAAPFITQAFSAAHQTPPALPLAAATKG
jgi:tetratricopeptide (TPR) repeat protein